MRLALLFAICLTIALWAAAPASAGVVCSVGGVATFAADDRASVCPGGADGASEANALTVTPGDAGVVFGDSQPIDDGDGAGGCSVAGNSATCPGTSTYLFDLGADNDTATITGVAPAFQASTGGAGADRLSGGPLADNLDGGPGNDTVDGGDGDDTLNGGADNDAVAGAGGNDFVSGGDGDDSVTGGEGHDRLEGVPGFGCANSGGNDTLGGDGGNDVLCGGMGPAGDDDGLNGGSGEDVVTYPRRDVGVNASIDGVANDGGVGEADNVGPDVENLVGTPAGDTLSGSDARNVIDGAAGGDTVSGGGGNDVLADTGGDGAGDNLNGGAGDDSLSAGLGPDSYAGGDGDDFLADYAGRVAGVRVSLDGQADDGEPGEGDNVTTDVENVTGGAGDDVITGSDGDNELLGGAGSDQIDARGGNDGVAGEAGRDRLDGGAGRDSVEGGAGADAISSRDGLTDRIVCGGGTDSVEAEGRDSIGGDCENLSIAPPAAVVISRTQVTRAGYVVVRVACPVIERQCSGVVIVKTVRRIAGRFIKLGQVGYRLRGGESKVFRARIAPRDRRPLRRARRVRVRTVVTNVNPETGASTNATKTATVTTRGL